MIIHNTLAIIRYTHGILLGPVDLSMAIGVPGDVNDPRVNQAMMHLVMYQYAGATKAQQKALSYSVVLIVYNGYHHSEIPYIVSSKHNKHNI